MTLVETLQDTLAAEHAAVFAFGLIGGRTSQLRPGQARTGRLFAAVSGAYAAHRTRRDDLTALLREQGVEPVPAAATYELPTDPVTPEQIRLAALQIERACAGRYSLLVAESADELRGWAIDALTDSAVRSLDFGGTPEAFPGADELTT